MKITLELSGTPDHLRYFIRAGLQSVEDPARHSLRELNTLACEILEAAVKDGAAGITLDAGDVRLTAPAQDHFPAIGVAGTVC